MERRQPVAFSAADYAVFVIMLLISTAIGVYFAYKDRKSKLGVQGYLMGGRVVECDGLTRPDCCWFWAVALVRLCKRTSHMYQFSHLPNAYWLGWLTSQLNKNMSYLPVAASLSLSFVSAITILGIPAEIYVFGSMYCWVLACIVVCIPAVTEIFIPIFYRIGITSSFEYLQLRYNYGVRLLATAVYILQNVMYIGISIYAPAVALSAVTSLNLWASIFSIGLVCTFYTTLGGLKAVIWTDVFQGFIVLLGTAATLFAGAARAGGWDLVWRLNYESGRIDFGRFDTDVRVRHSFWSLSIGLGFLWMSIFGTSQSQVQRYLCCKTEADAKKSVWVSMLVSGVIVMFSALTGFVMYAYFEGCDPLLNREVASPDQLLPYMVMDLFRDNPGLPGLFVASVFAGCLSTVSSGINAMACVTVEDFIRPFVTWTEKTLTLCSKGLVFAYGMSCIAFACLSSLLGGVLQAALSVLGIVGGPLLGIFSLGIVFPCGTSIGGAIGMVCGMCMTTWIYAGNQQYPPLREFTRPKPRKISECPDPLSIVLPTYDNAPRPDIADTFYSVSYAYYAAIGYAVTLAVGLLISLFNNGYQTRTEVNPRLIRPLLDHKILRWLPVKFRRFMWCGVRHDMVDAHEIIKVPAQPTRELRRRWSSRERTNSLRLSRRHWKASHMDGSDLSPTSTAIPAPTRDNDLEQGGKTGSTFPLSPRSTMRTYQPNSVTDKGSAKKKFRTSPHRGRPNALLSNADSLSDNEHGSQSVMSGVPSVWI